MTNGLLVIFLAEYGTPGNHSRNRPKLSTKDSDQYFNSRPRGSQLGAHVSDQSKKIETELHLKPS